MQFVIAERPSVARDLARILEMRGAGTRDRGQWPRQRARVAASAVGRPWGHLAGERATWRQTAPTGAIKGLAPSGGPSPRFCESRPHGFPRPFLGRFGAGFLSCFAVASKAASIARGFASWRALKRSYSRSAVAFATSAEIVPA